MALYAFDGTWNENQDVDERDTNVRKFFELSAEDDSHKLYTAGIGTRFGFLGRAFGGAFGVGGRERVNAAYDHLKNVWKPGVPIDVVGFSRGAALALDFVNRIAKGKGKPGAPQSPVRFLGLFDNVPAFGLPNVGPIEEVDLNIGHDLTLPKADVQFCAHALALDECREAFGIKRVDRAYEVWFRGCHSDIGGGNGNTRLSFITLRWMLRKAALCGVPIDQGKFAKLKLDAGADPAAALKLPKDLIRDGFRKCGAADRVHYTVGPIDGRPDRDKCNPFTFTTVETQSDEATVVPRV
jgi:uncharacterized protein (DUF2235 family)